MKFQSYSVFILLFLFSGYLMAQPVNLYVSVDGTDQGDGSKNKPYKSMEQVCRHLQEYKGEVIVFLKDGIHRINSPLQFSDANTSVFFKAEDGTNPIISGGVELKNWKQLENNIWEVSVPNGISAFRELFIEGKRAIRARHPNKGYLRVKKVGDDNRTNFEFDKGDFPFPEKTQEVELALLHDWSMTRINLKSINLKTNTIYAVDSIGAKCLNFFNLNNWEAHPRYFLENDRQFLDADYEWYFDKEERKVFLQLPQGKSPNNLLVEVPVTEQLIYIEGKPEQLVRNISFEGITFKHCKWELPELGYAGIQACHFDPRGGATKEWDVIPAAIHTRWAENISFNNCRFESFGTCGLWFDTGSRNCSVAGSRFFDISGNGIMIGEGQHRKVNGEAWWEVAADQVAIGNKVVKCTISECGVQFYGAVGIWCGLTAETVLENNELFQLPYSGISIGWMWSPQPTPCRENQIINNHIHHILTELSDGGGIYMLGLQPGSRLAGNQIHDVKINAGRAESNGMFLDEGTKNVVVEGNLIYNIAKSPLRFHRGETNLVKNNYLFCREGVPAIFYNRTKEEDITQIDNQIFSEEDANYGQALKNVAKMFNKDK